MPPRAPDADPDRPDPGERRAPGSWWRSLVPSGWCQWLVLGLAVCFLGASGGYLVGLRSAPERPKSGPVDEGFLQDMLDHHDQSVELALVAAERASDPQVRARAREVLVFQRREIGLMEAALAQRGVTRPDVDRDVMGWMDRPVPFVRMAGLVSQSDVDALATMTGPEVDRRFLELMIEHQGGEVEMAGYAADHAAGTDIRDMAASMSHNAQLDVGDYDVLLQRLTGRPS